MDRFAVKLVFVNRYFHPDLAPTGRLAARLAFDAAAQGREVHAIASRQRYEDARALLPAEETVQGVRIHRIAGTRFGRRSLAGRALDYLSFHAMATLALLQLLKRGDVVVAMTDPPLLSVSVAAAAGLRGARLVNWLQDVFPETATRAGVRAAGGIVAAIARRLRDWSVRLAADNIVLGRRMADELARLVPGASVSVVPNWADGRAIRPAAPESSPLRAAWGLAGKFVVGYSGNLGRVHECDTLIAAARLLEGDPQIAFAFVGDGHHMERVRAAGLRNAVFRDYVPEEHLAEGLAAFDVHLVTLLPVFEGLVVPSKFYGIAAAGRAVIFVGDPDGEIGRLIRAAGCGLSVVPGGGERLAEVIRGLHADRAALQDMGVRARSAFEREWDEPLALARWRQVVARAAA